MCIYIRSYVYIYISSARGLWKKRGCQDVAVCAVAETEAREYIIMVWCMCHVLCVPRWKKKNLLIYHPVCL